MSLKLILSIYSYIFNVATNILKTICGLHYIMDSIPLDLG